MQDSAAEKLARVEASLQRLRDVLQSIREEPRALTSTLAHPSLYPPLEALKATLDFLDNFKALRGEGRGKGPTAPLWDLLVALLDLQSGGVAPMFRPEKTGTRHTPIHFQALKLWAAVALDALMLAGRAQGDAAAVVATELAHIPISGGIHRNRATPGTVIEWRDQFSSGNGSIETQESWNRYARAERTRDAGADPEFRVVWALENLRGLAQGSTFRISP